MPMIPKEMVRFLKRNEFVEIRQKGSHLMMINYETGKRQLCQYIERICQKELNV